MKLLTYTPIVSDTTDLVQVKAILKAHSERQQPLETAAKAYGTIKNLAKGSMRQYLRAATVYGDFLGRQAVVSDLDDETFARFMAVRSEQVARETLRGECAKILTVWRWCAMPKRGWVFHPEVQSPESYYEVPKALDKHQLEQIWQHVDSLNAYIGLIPEKTFWPALFYILWDTSERIGAVYQLHRDDIDIRGRWITVYPNTRKGRRKQGRVYRIRKSTATAIQRLLDYTAADQPFADSISSNALYKRWRKMRVDIGLPQWATFHSIRRSHASHLTAAGGDARRSLGHSSEGITDRSYRDPKITSQGKQPCDMLFDPAGGGIFTKFIQFLWRFVR